jgi:hypothetical protein
VTPIDPGAGSLNMWRNLGKRHDSSGTAVVLTGTTGVRVAHLITADANVALEHIRVTPNNGMGSAAKFWVANVTATTFDLRVDADPTGTKADFSWQAMINF